MNKVVVITAPSGAGKTSIVKHLLAQDHRLAFSVSATTRNKRENEKDGKDYYFLSQDAFKALITQKAFVEFEEVYPGRYYGTLKKEVERIWKEGKTVLFDIDVKGALNVKEQYGSQCLSIFIQPPSFDILKQRLIDRHTEDDSSLQTRLDRVELEMTYSERFDCVVENDVLQTAQQEVLRIINNFLQPAPEY